MARSLNWLSNGGEVDYWHVVSRQPLGDLYLPERRSRLSGPRDAGDDTVLGQSPCLVLG
ncbi:hypothetical protein GA0115234_100914 [Streptomyces sp. DvalAA-43]|nr:hypothetical protein GA0115234_100914 [Streptomyces sp. DvalAA-43]